MPPFVRLEVSGAGSYSPANILPQRFPCVARGKTQRGQPQMGQQGASALSGSFRRDAQIRTTARDGRGARVVVTRRPSPTRKSAERRTARRTPTDGREKDSLSTQVRTVRGRGWCTVSVSRLAVWVGFSAFTSE